MIIIEKILNYIFKRRAIHHMNSVNREPSFVTYDNARTVLILFESDFMEKNPTIRNIIRQLHNDGKKVSAWGFSDKKEVNTAILPGFRILNKKQTDIFGQPHVSFLNELEHHEFDLLIDLTVKPYLITLYLAVYAHASFKVGIHKTDFSIYDFVLDLESIMTPPENSDPDVPFEHPVDETFIYNQVIFYLKSIQSQD